MIRCKVDRRRLVEKLRKMAMASPQARRDAVMVMTAEVLRKILREAPRDTNRYIRAWALAGNSAGLGPLPVPPLAPARLRERILKRLVAQVRFWEYVVGTYQRKNRHDRWHTRAVHKLNRARQELERFAQTPEGAVLAINLFARGASMTTVRHKVYGGEGRVVALGEKTYVVLRNLEPHASIVESRTRVARNASAAYRGLLGRAGKSFYVSRVARAAGTRAAAGAAPGRVA